MAGRRRCRFRQARAPSPRDRHSPWPRGPPKFECGVTDWIRAFEPALRDLGCLVYFRPNAPNRAHRAMQRHQAAPGKIVLPSNDAAVLVHFRLGDGQQFALEGTGRGNTRMATLGRQALAVDDDPMPKPVPAATTPLVPVRVGFAAQPVRIGPRAARPLPRQARPDRSPRSRGQAPTTSTTARREKPSAALVSRAWSPNTGPSDGQAADVRCSTIERLQRGAQQRFARRIGAGLQLHDADTFVPDVAAEAHIGAADVAQRESNIYARLVGE